MTQFRQETPNGHITFHYKSSSNIEHPQISPKLLQNQNKSFFQFTTNCFPKSLKTFERAKLPFAVFFQPFASVLNDEPIPVIPETKTSLRCIQCRAFANPFFKFIDKGDFYVCNICGGKNETPPNYFSESELKTRKKVELNYLSYDIIVGSDYAKRPTVSPLYFFLIDVSKPVTKSGTLETFSKALKEAILNNYLYGGSRTKIGILAYDSKIYAFDLGKSLKQPKITVISKGFDETFTMPFPDVYHYNKSLQECKEGLLALLDSFPAIFSKNEDSGNAFNEAFKMAIEIVKPSGGKVIFIQGNDEFFEDTDKEETSRTYSSNYFACLSRELIKLNISISIFCHSKCYKNIITIGDFVRYLNGDIFYYCEDSELNQTRFYHDLRSVLSLDCAWESVFRVRVSTNWSVNAILGNYAVLSTDLLAISNVDETKALCYEFLMRDEPLDEGFYIQSCLLFTSSQGDRRFRCHNFMVKLGNLESVYDEIDEKVLSCFFFRIGLAKIYKKQKLEECKKILIQACKEIYKEKLKLKIDRNKEALKEPLIYMPLYVLGMIKHEVFNANYEPSYFTDRLNAFRIKANNWDLQTTILNFIPILYCLHGILNKGYFKFNEETGEFIFPLTISLTCEMLDETGIYLMDLGDSLIFYIRKKARSEDKELLFYEVAGEKKGEIYWTERMSNLLSELNRSKISKYCPVFVAREGDNGLNEKKFWDRLIEDKSKKNLQENFEFSYEEFIHFLYQ